MKRQISKVKDHSHDTNKYRGVPDSICNLKYGTPKDIPVVFHRNVSLEENLIV